MILLKKILITTFLIFISYNLYIAWLAPYWWQASQNQLQRNIVNAQNFLFNKNATYDRVIVGSSLASRLSMEHLPNTYNLSFSGLSPLDGLDVLVREPILPRTILIETNVLQLSKNETFTDHFNNPFMLYTRKVFPCLLEGKQPLTVLGILPFIVFKKDKASFFKAKIETPHRNLRGSFIFEKLINTAIKNHSSLPDTNQLIKNIRNMRYYVHEIESRGSNVIFFEMPINYRLENLPMTKITRETFFKNFDTMRYRCITLPKMMSFETTDGIHLGGSEALKYTVYFKNKLESIAIKSK